MKYVPTKYIGLKIYDEQIGTKIRLISGEGVEEERGSRDSLYFKENEKNTYTLHIIIYIIAYMYVYIMYVYKTFRAVVSLRFPLSHIPSTLGLLLYLIFRATNTYNAGLFSDEGTGQ